ncbi:MAK10-like protein [Tanacetum coccineum]
MLIPWTSGRGSKPTPPGFIKTWSITTLEDLTTRFLSQFFPPRRTAKLHNDILMFQQHQGESLSEACTRFKDLLQKVPHHEIDLWLQVQIFYDHVNPVTRRTIDQSAGGKLCDRNAKESWALFEDLALYDNESWNDPRDFAKPVKVISLPQDISSTSDRRLIELENQVQRLMEAHFALTQPTQVNKITTSCEICIGPHDTQYCMEDPEQAFVEYASSRTDEVGGKWYTFKPEQNNLDDTYNPSWKSHLNLSFNNQSNLEGFVSDFMASQDAKLSKFEADFKQQQSEMTNKIETMLKATTDRLVGSLLSDTVKNSKLSTSLVLSARSYPTIDPQCSSHPSTSINAIKTCSTKVNISQTSQLQTGVGIGTQQLDRHEPTIEDEFQDLHLNLPVLEVLAPTPIYNAILDKYVESLELGKNGSPFVQGEVSTKMEDSGLFTLPCRLGDSKPFDTLADLGSCVNIIPLYLFKKLNIRLLKETDHIFGLADGTKSYPDGIVKDVKVHIGKLKLLNDFYIIDMKKDLETLFLVGAQTPYYARKDFLDCHLPREWEIARDAEINPFKDVLRFRRMEKPPINGDGEWHAKIRLIDLDGEEFTKTLQSIPTTRKLSERESQREIIDLEHFYDT